MPNLHCEAIAFPSSDGKHTLRIPSTPHPASLQWAVLQLSHGMCEYAPPCIDGRVLRCSFSALRWRATTISPR